MQGAAPRGRENFAIEFKQKYQVIEGTVQGFERSADVRDPRIDGERVLFTIVDNTDFAHRVRYEGRVKGDTMEGTLRGEGSAPRGVHRWRAVRAQP